MTTEVLPGISHPHLFDRPTLERMVQIWRVKEDRIVFTNGCFDVLHRGHVAYLEEAAALGDRLIVGINSDDSVRRLGKAPDRPYNDQRSRAIVIAALRCVDAVTIFDEDTPLELIRTIVPDLLVKGGDWAVRDIVGADIVTAAGGVVRSLKLVDGFSTTALVERIRG
ncbi:MAG: D-glycero-beta-D-manno-heptose 1-phosphate adenylyltransferase [Flavobacteriales bacterium]|nr:D-glycero-beta-D-manno-heptose 1-phosphate adenylyltransferase [Flavobacteriales bacterium]MCB9193449.1 D-glycero-beta-D-manno-heptose 1-phosphate adenylyltransferase [Flavobacteriales bacterium]